MNTFEDYVRNTSQPMPLSAQPEFNRPDGDAPEITHRKAADVHERAVRHHREAARLLEKGDHRQADIHANIALGHAQSAAQLETQIRKWEPAH